MNKPCIEMAELGVTLVVFLPGVVANVEADGEVKLAVQGKTDLSIVETRVRVR